MQPSNSFKREQARNLNSKVYKKGEKAHAKLVAENGREFFIQETSSLIVDIGREKRTDPNYFNLSDQNTLSKKHAQIFWDFDQQAFFVRNFSKNKI